MAALRAEGIPTEAFQLRGKGKWVEETAWVRVLIRERTGVKNRWAAGRLGMGHEGNVIRSIRRANEHPVRKIDLARLEVMLVNRN